MRPFETSFTCDTADGGGLLAAVRYCADTPAPEPEPGHIVVPLPGDEGAGQTWRSITPVQSGREHGIAYRENADVLFGYLPVHESDDHSLETIGTSIYQRIARLTAERGFPHVLRVWQYIPHINAVQDGLERYQRFCVGRQHALDGLAQHPKNLPAACGIGTYGGPVCIYFMAGKSPGIQIENPRQVSAFDYPEQYSPRSPAFSRALLKEWQDGAHLYISGTASITGHQSRHHGNLLAQAGEALTNVEALIATANKYDKGRFHLQENACWRIYVRRPEDLPAVREFMNGALGHHTQRTFLRGDICREELLVEIEGLCQST